MFITETRRNEEVFSVTIRNQKFLVLLHIWNIWYDKIVLYYDIFTFSVFKKLDFLVLSRGILTPYKAFSQTTWNPKWAWKPYLSVFRIIKGSNVAASIEFQSYDQFRMTLPILESSRPTNRLMYYWLRIKPSTEKWPQYEN